MNEDLRRQQTNSCRIFCQKLRRIANYWRRRLTCRWVGIARCTIDKYPATDVPPSTSRRSADFTRSYNLWYGFGAPMCPGPDSRSSADPVSRRCRPINQLTTTDRAIVRPAYTMVSDGCRCAPCGSRAEEDTIWFSAYGRARRVQRSRAYSSS